MNPTPMVRVNQFLRGSVPMLLTLLLVLLGSLPFALPYFSILCPLFAVMSVYYWSIYRPDLMPLGAAFLIGFFVDVLSGGPMGLMALVLVLVQAMVASQRRAFLGKSFAVGWWGFGLVATGAVLLSWLISSVFFTQVLDPLPAIGQLTVSIAVYPLMLLLFGSVQRTLLPVI